MVSPNRANESVNPPPAGRNIMTKRAAKRKAKREGVNTSYESRKVGMSLQEQRRVCEMAFLKRWPKIIPKGLFVKCRRLFKRKAEKLTDDDARYEHDTARRKAVELLSRERVRGGLDTVKEGDEWGELAKTDKEQWLKNEVDEMGWIIERLEVKNTPFNEGSMATPHGKLAVWRDFLHSTLRLENNGGVPDKTIPWLHDLLSYPAYRKSKESDHAEMAWKLGVQQALNFLVACRRRDGVNGTFERTGEHRYHKVEVDEWCRDWDPEDFMEEEWAAVRGVGGVGEKAEGDDALAEHKKEFLAKLSSYETGLAKIASSNKKKALACSHEDPESRDQPEATEAESDDGGVCLRVINSEGESMPPEPVCMDEEDSE